MKKISLFPLCRSYCIALALTSSALLETSFAAQFPLPIPTRPTNFPLQAPSTTGTVIAWGGDLGGETAIPAGLVNAVQVSAGFAHGLALKSDGTVVAWGGTNYGPWGGTNTYGEAIVPSGLSNVVQVVAGQHSAALKSDGSISVWGRNDHGQANTPAGLTNVVQLSHGPFQSVALKIDGSVVAWGYNYYGDTSVMGFPMSFK